MTYSGGIYVELLSPMEQKVFGVYFTSKSLSSPVQVNLKEVWDKIPRINCVSLISNLTEINLKHESVIKLETEFN